MKKVFLLLLAISIGISSFAQTKWTVDPMHSFVTFSVKHMGISFVTGSFKKFDGAISASKADLSDAKINFTVEVGSISTDVEQRNNHLKTDDFFNAEKYPQMTFESTSFKKISEGNYALNGKLTIRDVTKDVKFDVVYGGTAEAQGKTKAGFSASTTINRFDYHIMFDPTGTGVGKDVDIKLNLEFFKGQ